MAVQDFFDRYARDFDAIYGHAGRPGHKLVDRLFRKSMRLRFERTIEGCMPIDGGALLDVGCGSGHYSTVLAAKGARRVLGIDFSAEMLELARARAEDEKTADRCEFRHVDVFDLPEDETFDYTIVMGVMDYIADPEKLVDKVCRLTRSRAFFSFPVVGGLLAWQRKLRYRSRCPLYFYDEQDLIRLFDRATPHQYKIERIARDFMVVLNLNTSPA